MPPALSNNQQIHLQNAVANCSAQQVRQIFTNAIVPNLGNRLWLNNRNRYLVDAARRVDYDASNSFREEDLKEYVAISSILHCKDGWDFYESAVKAIISGNFQNAIHFAYYAELRAVMSFLASDGIGVFNRKHVFINHQGELKKVSNTQIPTHSFVWHMIQEWSNGANKSDIIFKTINVNGKSIYDWLIAAGMLIGSTSTGRLATDWLQDWSLDLRIVSEDHNIRNEVSYRPQEIKRSIAHSTETDFEFDFILKKWELCEPVSTEKFRYLDYYLLRTVLVQRYLIHFGKRPTRTQLTTFVQTIMSRLGMSRNSLLENFLTGRHSGTLHPVLKLAKLKPKDKNGAYRPFSMLSRSFLLLRLATAATNDLLVFSGASSGNIQFWWEKIGVDNGYWSSGNSPSMMNDLWVDVEDAIKSVRPSLSQANIDRYTLNRYHPTEVCVLPQFKRALLWGLNL